MIHNVFIIGLLITIVPLTATAQGCSDGGFCSLKYHNDKKATKNEVAIGNVIGIGDASTLVNNTYLSYSRILSSKVILNAKFTTNYASGSIANNFNVGDVFATVTGKVWQNAYQTNAVTLLGGVKIPLTSGNDKAGNKPLPMAYQSSLGTFDALVGANVKINKWEFTQAWQIPLTKENKNTFIQEYATTNDFPSTNAFGRKADALLRAAYTIQKKKSKFLWKPNLLAIYHLGEDTYETIFGNRANLVGSKGLTLNANIIGNYRLKQNQQIEFSIAAPLVVRDIRPDGLTRSFTFGVEYKISF